MATGWENVLLQALALPPEERAQVVVALERSIGDDAWPPHEVPEDSPNAVLGAELLGELRRRSDAVRTGSAQTFAAEEVIAELIRRQNAEDAR